MLEWKDGRCQNPPAGWHVGVHLRKHSPVWRWRAAKLSEFGSEKYPIYEGQVYQTERAAQFAVESALIRLVVIPLPAWHQNLACLPTQQWVWVPGDDTDCPTVGTVWLGDRGFVFSTAACAVSRPYSSWRAAQAAAEIHLRAELAAYLDELAAKEGAL